MGLPHLLNVPYLALRLRWKGCLLGAFLDLLLRLTSLIGQPLADNLFLLVLELVLVLVLVLELVYCNKTVTPYVNNM